MPTNAVPSNSYQPDPSEKGFGGAGNLTGEDQQMPSFLNNEFVDPGGIVSGLLTGIFGGKYQVPNPTSTANQGILGDISNLGNLGNLAEGSTEISAESAAEPYEMNLPGYEENLSQAAGNAGSELEGVIPQDVQDLIQNQAAERGIETGQGADSPDSNASLLQDLGLTSLGEEQTGLQGLEGLIGSTPTGQQFNTSSFEVTPEQEQAAQLAANEEAAAPQPQLAGLAESC